MNVIIRPRGGDFCCSETGFEMMKLDIELCKRAGADGVVIGSGAREVHGYLPVTVEGRMLHRNPRVFMGGELRAPEYATTSTDPARVAALRRALP